MPQLDLLTFFSQITWLLITFITLYVVSARIIIPSISKSLITRRLLLKNSDITNENEADGSNTVQEVEKSLHSDIKLFKSLISEIKNINIELQKKDTNTIINEVLTPINKTSNDITLQSKVTAFAYIKKAR